MDLNITLTLFNDPLRKQLKNQNIDFNKQEMKILEKASFHAMSLRFHDIITETELHRILNVIHEKIKISIVKHTSSK